VGVISFLKAASGSTWLQRFFNAPDDGFSSPGHVQHRHVSEFPAGKLPSCASYPTASATAWSSECGLRCPTSDHAAGAAAW